MCPSSVHAGSQRAPRECRNARQTPGMGDVCHMRSRLVRAPLTWGMPLAHSATRARRRRRGVLFWGQAAERGSCVGRTGETAGVGPRGPRGRETRVKGEHVLCPAGLGAGVAGVAGVAVAARAWGLVVWVVVTGAGGESWTPSMPSARAALRARRRVCAGQPGPCSGGVCSAAPTPRAG